MTSWFSWHLLSWRLRLVSGAPEGTLRAGPSAESLLELLIIKKRNKKKLPRKKRRADSALQWMSIIPIKSNKTISKKLWMKNTSRNQTWKGKEKKRHSCNCQNGKVREMEKQMERKLQIQRKQICNSSNLAKPNTGTTRPGIENENFTFLFDFWDPKKKDSCQFNNTKQREKKRQKNNINSKNNKNKQRKS